jgi:spoIIIJ-associated protein
VTGDDDSGRLASGEGADVDESFPPADGSSVMEAAGEADVPRGNGMPPQGGAGPDGAGPDSADRGSADPGSAGLGSAGPDSAGPDSAGPDSAGPDRAGPQTAPGAAEVRTGGDVAGTAGDGAAAGGALGGTGAGAAEAGTGSVAADGASGTGGEPGDAEEDEDSQESGEPAERRPTAADLEQESEIAADYIEGLLDVADLDGDIDMDVDGERPLVSVVGATLTELVGPHGEVLEALQELTRLAVHRQTGVRSRIMLDVGGYRARRREELTELGQNAAREVSRTGAPRRLAAMTPFERKIVHDAVAAAGLRSESEGEDPDRRVVVFPAG